MRTHVLTLVMLTLLASLWAPPATADAAWPSVREGAIGAEVQAIQHLLTAHGHATTPDGRFGPGTTSNVKTFQSRHGLVVDGMVGPQTWPYLVITVQAGSSGSPVRAAQVLLNKHGYALSVDGQFGSVTTDAVRAFQSRHGLAVDGQVGPVTWRHLTGTATATQPPPATGDYSLPLPRATASRAAYAAPHWNANRAVDLIVPTGTPVYATQAATVERFQSSSCGNGLRVVVNGNRDRLVYCHLDAYVGSAGWVTAGRQIGISGDTGDSGAPHLHIEVQAGAANRCPQPYLVAIYDGRVPPSLASLPTTGCTA